MGRQPSRNLLLSTLFPVGKPLLDYGFETRGAQKAWVCMLDISFGASSLALELSLHCLELPSTCWVLKSQAQNETPLTADNKDLCY
jgi:hypothetical protein